MTVVTPEMEKKQEEAMDKFLAKQVQERQKNLRVLSRWMRKHFFSGHPANLFSRTYIPLAKYHAWAYKEEEEGGKTLPFAMYLTTTELYCYESKNYRKFNVLRFDSRSDGPFSDQQLAEAKDRTLATYYVDGFLYHKSSGYYVSPEGWTPPAEWQVDDQREKKKD